MGKAMIQGAGGMDRGMRDWMWVVGAGEIENSLDLTCFNHFSEFLSEAFLLLWYGENRFVNELIKFVIYFRT